MARGFPYAVLGSSPGSGDPLGAPALLFPGWSGERTLRGSQGSSGMVVELKPSWSRGSTSSPAGWRLRGTGAAQGVPGQCQELCASPGSLLCSSALASFKSGKISKSQKRLRGVGTSEVTTGGSCPGHSSGCSRGSSLWPKAAGHSPGSDSGSRAQGSAAWWKSPPWVFQQAEVAPLGHSARSSPGRWPHGQVRTVALWLQETNPGGLCWGKSMGKELQKLVGTGTGWEHTGQSQP